jgi:hypothetical protein
VDLIDAFVKSTTADQFHLADSNSEQIRKDGCAYLLAKLTKRKCREMGRLSPYLQALQDYATGGDPGAYAALARNYCLNRRFFITLHGRLGIGPKWTKQGDMVCVLFGGGVPYILCPKGRHYTFIGESYVYGLMEGQAIDAWRKDKLKDEIFRLQ